MKIDRDGKLNLNTLFLGLYLSLFSMIDIELAKTKKYLNHEIESVRRKTILTSTLKKYISTFAVCIMVAVVFSSVVYSNVKAEIKGTQPPENNAWIISNETYVGNETLVMNDDIIITETGKLTLFNCILEMNCSINGSYYIEVQNGGIFNLMYSKVTNGTINASYDFYFANGSNGLIHRSIIEKAGYQGGGSKGIKVESNNLTIFESIIQNCYNGIWAEKSAPIIINSTIRENLENGIYWESGCKLWEDQFQDLSKTSELVNAQIISKNIFLKYNEYTTDSNTEALIHLNDGIGSTATDSSGNGNSGTITGAQWTGDNLLGDYALYFDGSDRVNFGDEFDLTDGSIEMWFNLTENFNNSCTDDMMLYSKYMIQGGKEYSVKLKLEADDGKIYFNITKQDNQYSIYSNSVSWMNNTWYHVAGTWGSNGMKMYINNTLQLNTNSYNDYWGNKNSEAYLGIFYDETSYLNGFEGIIDEFRVSDIQRTDFIDYVSQGNLVSVTIPSNLFNKRTLLNISKTEPDSNHYITLSIYDGNNKLIPGFENLVGENIDISSISPNEYPILKLKVLPFSLP